MLHGVMGTTSATLRMLRCQVKNCEAASSGGAIEATYAKLHLEQCTFTNNKANVSCWQLSLMCHASHDGNRSMEAPCEYNILVQHSLGAACLPTRPGLNFSDRTSLNFQRDKWWCRGHKIL